VDLFSDTGFDRLSAALHKRTGTKPLGAGVSDTSGPPDAPSLQAGSRAALEARQTVRPSPSGILFSTDGSQFVDDLKGVLRFLEDFGIRERVEVTPMAPPAVFVVVRGNNFCEGGDPRIWEEIQRTLSNGGIVLATAFASWEAYGSRLVDLFPFTHTERVFWEKRNVSITSSPEWSGSSKSPAVEVVNSYELLQPRPSSEVFLWQNGTIPLLGSHKVGDGLFIYLNLCQHSCGAPMSSPLSESAELRQNIGLCLWEMVGTHLRKPA
jgi:hypothetical protein